MSSTRSHKRKNSHLFLQRKNSSSADMSSYEMNPLVNEGNTGEIERNTFQPEDIENQPLPKPSTTRIGLHVGAQSIKFRRLSMMAILALLIIISLFIVPYYSNSSSQSKPQDNYTSSERSFTIEEVLKGDFLYDETTFHFLKPSELIKNHDIDPGLYITAENENQNEEAKIFVAKQLFDKEFREDLGKSRFVYDGIEYIAQNVKVNYRLDRMILGTNIKPKFRHSSEGYYWIKDLTQGTIKPISPLPSGELREISNAYFSPSYNFVHFIYANNLYIQNVYSGGAAQQITTDGSSDISNGKPDWIYEEEILASDKAVWWAPDDSKMVFARFDDTEVESYYIPKYTSKEQHAPISSVKYPKPGMPNPKIQLYLLDMEEGVVYLLSTSDNEEEDDKNSKTEIILYDADWISSDLFLFKITDRASKKMLIRLFDITVGSLKTVRTIDANSYNGWIDKSKKILPIPPNDAKGRKDYGYVEIHADLYGFNHLFYYKTATSEEGRQLTSGQWEITGTGIVGYEYETDTILFTANEIGPMSQHLYGVSLDSQGEGSLKILQDPVGKEEFYEYELSSSSRYALMRQLGPEVPYSAAGLLPNVLNAKSIVREKVVDMTDNANLKETLQKYDLPVTSYKSMTTDDGVTINYVEIKPAVLDPKKKYPILVNVYGGPGSQTYNTKFSMFFEQAVSSGLDAIVLQIEPRGTGGMGWHFRSWARDKIGYWEPRDITEITKKFIQHNEPHIDTNRTAIWGWSYGGYTTLKTIEFDEGDTFKYAMAVAPVTNWTFYDSFYTERYMEEPSKNLQGYNDISVVQDLHTFDKLQRFLIIHGSADDNVHIENTYQFLDGLNMLGITNYDMHIFPDSDHSIRHHNAQNIVFRKLYYWLKDAFSGRFDTASL